MCQENVATKKKLLIFFYRCFRSGLLTLQIFRCLRESNLKGLDDYGGKVIARDD